MDSSLILLVIVVATALAFDFTNGFHDTANAMATTIATEALPPRVTVAVAGALNFAPAAAAKNLRRVIRRPLLPFSLISAPVFALDPCYRILPEGCLIRSRVRRAFYWQAASQRDSGDPTRHVRGGPPVLGRLPRTLWTAPPWATVAGSPLRGSVAARRSPVSGSMPAA